MEAQGHRVIVVADDDEAIRLLCRVNLELEGYRVVEASTAAELARVADAAEVSLVLLDIHLGNDDGIEVAKGLRARLPNVPIALLSGSVPFGERAIAVSDAAIRKPFALEELIETVHRLARAAPPPRAPSR